MPVNTNLSMIRFISRMQSGLLTAALLAGLSLTGAGCGGGEDDTAPEPSSVPSQPVLNLNEDTGAPPEGGAAAPEVEEGKSEADMERARAFEAAQSPEALAESKADITPEPVSQHLPLLQAAVDSFYNEHKRVPKSVEEMIKTGNLSAMPRAPHGMKFSIDPTKGTVTLVKAQ
jgi:hypothetical protein